MALLEELLADLRAEGEDLDRIVAPLDPADWCRPTPAEGWTIAHQIAHLADTDRIAALAATDPAAFAGILDRAYDDPAGFNEAGAARGVALPPPDLLALWRDARTQLVDVIAGLPGEARVPWFGPSMSPASMLTARLMETWAHGQDVADALGVVRTPTRRLRHVAHIGVRTRDYAFGIWGLTPPAAEFRVELQGADGEPWTWGPADAEQRVTGPALDFCLLAVQRRHRQDLHVVAEGPDADRWLDIVQAFAGPPGKGRRPGQFF